MYACERLALPGMAPEDIAVLPDGCLICGLADGRIISVNALTGEHELIVQIKGRPLGIEVKDAQHIIVCDGQRGQLLEINILKGKVKTLLKRVRGRKIKLCNNAAIARDGRIFFSQSSAHYAVQQWQMDLIQHAATGALHCLYPDGRVETLLTNLAFANGVALLPDESSVLVAETGRNQIIEFNLHTRKSLCFTTLPGVPDNMSTGESGIIWVAIPSKADWRLDTLKKLPYATRFVIAKTLGRMKLPVKPHAQVLGYNSYGRLVRQIDIDPAQYQMITGVREHQGKLYLGSLHEEAIGVVDLTT